MAFNFQELYKNLSNIELLKIARQPSAYEAEAVTAATNILKERNISNNEYEAVDEFIIELKIKAENKKQKIASIKEKTYSFIEPVIMPGNKLEPEKWLNIFLLLVTFHFGWELFGIAGNFIRFFKCVSCGYDFPLFIDSIATVCMPIIIFLLFKRKRWGWILLFADSLFSGILELSESYIFFKYQNIHHGDTVSFVEPIILDGFFVVFLCRNEIAQYFNVAKTTKKATASVVVIIALIFVVLVNVFVNLMAVSNH